MTENAYVCYVYGYSEIIMGNIIMLHNIQLISLNRNPVNRSFRKWVGCEALAPIQDNGSLWYLSKQSSLSCMGAKASQPTHFLKFRLTGFRLNEINCNTMFEVCLRNAIQCIHSILSIGTNFDDAGHMTYCGKHIRFVISSTFQKKCFEVPVGHIR